MLSHPVHHSIADALGFGPEPENTKWIPLKQKVGDTETGNGEVLISIGMSEMLHSTRRTFHTCAHRDNPLVHDCDAAQWPWKVSPECISYAAGTCGQARSFTDVESFLFMPNLHR
jgi:hypothetical protein